MKNKRRQINSVILNDEKTEQENDGETLKILVAFRKYENITTLSGKH